MTKHKTNKSDGVSPEFLKSNFTKENARALANYLSLADPSLCSHALKEVILIAPTHKMGEDMRQELLMLIQFVDSLAFHEDFFVNPHADNLTTED